MYIIIKHTKHLFNKTYVEFRFNGMVMSGLVPTLDLDEIRGMFHDAVITEG